MLLAALFAIVVAAGCEPHPIPYLTSVDPPGSTHPARYLDETFAVERIEDVIYSTADDLDGNPVPLALDIYQPTDDLATSRPAIILVHGGGFRIHNKRESTVVDLAQHFAATGYVAVSIDYRLLANVNCGGLGGVITPESGCVLASSAAISDGSAAVRWVRANAATYRIDPTRIAMMGDSAGAITSIGVGMFAGATNEWMANVVSGSPQNPVAEALLFGAPPNESNLGQDSSIRAWISFSGGFPPSITGVNLPQLVADNWPGDLPAAGMFFHGTADPQVPYAWGETVRDHLAGIGRLVVWEGFDGLGHVASLWSNEKQTILDQSTWFLYTMLDLAHAEQ